MYKPAFTSAGRLMAALALLISLSVPAQAEDTYRAEIVILERLADPVLEEHMAGKRPETEDSSKRLWVVDESGNVHSDISLTNNLTLNTAASRLENSGKYRVLMKTGWIQEFPQDYNGEPLRIEVGEFLERAGHRAVEGTIEINRRRYLLVDVALNHWREADTTAMQFPQDSIEEKPENPTAVAEDNTDDDAPVAREAGTSAVSGAGMTAPAGKELITWIRETRRMRSKEIHFLDSPTIGVLVYFRPMD